MRHVIGLFVTLLILGTSLGAPAPAAAAAPEGQLT
jgi:hypothetical protein